MTKSKFTVPLIIAHSLIILLAFTSPFWLDWRVITIGVILDYLQIFVIGGCILSLAQFEDKDMTFHEWYLGKLGVKVSRTQFNFVIRYIVPILILLITYGYQLIFAVKVPLGL